jgi:hypothetical protein
MSQPQLETFRARTMIVAGCGTYRRFLATIMKQPAAGPVEIEIQQPLSQA